jgi:hypothetical protein
MKEECMHTRIVRWMTAATCAFALGQQVNAQVVIDDPFTDGTLQGGADPLSADFVAVNQIDANVNKAIVTDAVLDPSVGGKVLQYSVPNGGDRTLIGYSLNGSTPGYNAMNVGDKVVLSMAVRIASSANGSALGAGANLNFRIGMFNNNGTRQPGDTTGTALGNGSAIALSGDDSGYAAILGANGRDGTGAEVLANNQAYIVREAGTADPMWFGADRVFVGGNSGVSENLPGNSVFDLNDGTSTFGRLSVDGTVYKMLLEFVKNGDGTATVRSVITDANNVLIAGTSGTDTSPLNALNGFNEVAILIANNTSVISIDNVRLAVIPEPATLAVLAAASPVLLRRRRQA